MAMARKEELGRNDRVDRGKLPLRLLIDPRIQEIEVGNDVAANLKYSLTLLVFATSIAMLGTLLLSDQTSPTQVLFEGVLFVFLLIPIPTQLDRLVAKCPDAKGNSSLCGPKVTQRLVRSDGVGDIFSIQRCTEFLQTLLECRRRNTLDGNSMSSGDRIVVVARSRSAHDIEHSSIYGR